MTVDFFSFHSVYFSARFNISFQLSIYQVIFSNLKNLFSHCLSSFFPFHKLQLCLYIGKFWYIYVIGIKINKKPPCLLYFTEFSDPLFIKTLSFIRDLRVGRLSHSGPMDSIVINKIKHFPHLFLLCP